MPEDICEDFDQMIQNKPIENQILVFLPNEMVDYDALRNMILHIYQLKESIRYNFSPISPSVWSKYDPKMTSIRPLVHHFRVFVYHFNVEYEIKQQSAVDEVLQSVYHGMVNSYSTTLPKNNIKRKSSPLTHFTPTQLKN